MENKRLLNILLLIFSILIFLLVSEMVTRILIEPPLKKDMGWEIVSENKVMGYELTPNKTGIYQGYFTYVNEYGRRDNHNTNYFPNTKLVAFVGDSFTFGQGVDQNNTIPKKFEELYNSKFGDKIAALNFGVGGYNLEQEIGLIKEKVLPYSVSTIFVVFYINDIESKIDISTQTKKHKKNSIPKYLKVYNSLLKHSRFLSFIKFRLSNIIYKLGVTNQGYVNYYYGIYHKDSDSWDRFRRNLSALSKIQEDNGIKIYYVIYPTLGYLNDKHPYLEIYDQVIKEVNSYGVDTINLFPAFENKDATKLRANMYDNHPNKEANRIVAEYIIDEIGK